MVLIEKLKNSLLELKDVEKVEQKGLFINIFIKPERLINKLYTLNNIKIKKEDKNIMIEFSSPNSNKPLHLGHLRNTILGNSLSNLLSLKYNVIRANLINDRGVHICKSMLGYKLFSKYKSPEDAKMKPDHFIGYCYVLFSKEEKANPELTKKAVDMLKEWEIGNKEVRDLWNKMRNWALSGLKESYNSFDIKFDKYFFESNIYKKGKKIVLDKYKENVIKKDEKGNYIISLGRKIPKKVLLRNDNTSIYITQDIYLAKLKYDNFNLYKSIYVIGSEQDLYMQQLFEVIKKLKINVKNKFEHFSYGMISLPNGKMKSREGNVVDWDNFLEDVFNTSKEIVKGKWNDLPEKELNKRAMTIAKTSIIYFMLKYDAKKDFVFDVNKSLSFEGDSGAYLLYTYARLNSVLRKIKRFKFKRAKHISKWYNKEEKDLVRLMLKINYKLPFFIEKESLHLIIRYFTDLANMFNSVYAKHKFITNKKEMKNRLIYLEKLKEEFDLFFNILNIKPLRRM